MLGECSIRELVASFEEAYLPLRPAKRVCAGWFIPDSVIRRWVTRIAAIVAWAC